MTDTYHSENPITWRTHHAVERLTRTKWDVLARTVDDARRQARPAPANDRADGFPRGGSGGRGGAELTSVEAAAESNLFGRTTAQQESLHELVTEAQALLIECSGTAALFTAKVELIRSLLGAAEHELRACDLCGATDRHPRFGDVGGRLPVSRSLCADASPGQPACYDVVARNGGWPSEEQREQFERTGRWRYRVSDRAS